MENNKCVQLNPLFQSLRHWLLFKLESILTIFVWLHWLVTFRFGPLSCHASIQSCDCCNHDGIRQQGHTYKLVSLSWVVKAGFLRRGWAPSAQSVHILFQVWGSRFNQTQLVSHHWQASTGCSPAILLFYPWFKHDMIMFSFCSLSIK